MEENFRKKRQDEVDKNYEIFKKKLPDIIKEHRGKFALLRHQEILDFFENYSDAETAGKLVSKDDNLFSIQEVKTGEINLGYFSYAKI